MTIFRRILPAAFALLPILSHAAGDAGSCSYAPLGKLDLDVSPRHPPVLNGTINGKPAPMLLATGDHETRLLRVTADRIGLRLESTGKYTFFLNGPRITYRTHIDDLGVGESHTGRTVVPVVDSNGIRPDYDAVVGSDFLLQTDLEVSIKDKFVQPFRARGCGDTFLAYWDRDAMEVPFIGKEEKTNRPFIPVELNGVKLTAIIDTGLMTSIIKRHAAEQAGIDLDGPQARKIGETTSVNGKPQGRWSVDFKSFSIGDETINNPRMTVVEDSPSFQGRSDLYLGMDFLRAHHVLFAMSQSRLYLSYLGDPLFGAEQQSAAAPKAP